MLLLATMLAAVALTLSAGDVVLDVGANIGLFSMHCARAGAAVLAFEPIPVFSSIFKLRLRSQWCLC